MGSSHAYAVNGQGMSLWVVGRLLSPASHNLVVGELALGGDALVKWSYVNGDLRDRCL